ncbi:intermembrane lipid transfer protein Vps13-like [Oppia nitens]|uniref:intermembrane lipid transfer protein Vps13-like n=1 Tax=Oppia nitens TaxID=1686743 RepID=UPI0023DC2283|nr:intermembrane lipid transfer protein Vps13-like [Oppia nitens]
MVFESLVANLLNKYLSQFVDELTAKQLNLFAWSGNISLDNIAIKGNAFDSLSLPFRVIHGHIARIECSIPWKSLYSSPVVIKLSDVYVLAVPNAETKYDDPYEELLLWTDKLKQLEKIEEAKQRTKDTNGKQDKNDKNGDSFATKFAAQIVKNLQVFISNVHICYEDRISWPKNPFQVGLTLHKLVFETKQSDVSSMAMNDNIICKLVSIEGLSFYWNCNINEDQFLMKFDDKSIDELLKDRIATKHNTPTDLQYILYPINFSSNTVIHRKPEVDDYSVPILDAQMDLDMFELSMTRTQFECLLLLLDAIDRMNLAKPYRKWRPSVPISGNSKRWWRFAFNAIMETDIKRRSNNWSWLKICEHRLKMKRYQELYKRKLLAINVDQIKLEIETLEKDLNLLSIVLARSQAELETQQILNTKKEESKKKKGWFSGWFSSKDESSSSEEVNIVDDFKKEMTTDEKQRFYEAIGYEEGIPEELPKDFIAHRIKFMIGKLFITVSDETEKITQLSLLGVSLNLSNRPSSHCLALSTNVKSLFISGIGGIPILEELSTLDVLSLEFDMNPLDGLYDYGVIMKMSGFKLMYDANTINTFIEMLSPPKDISLEELQSIAAFRFQNWSQRTALSLEYAIEKHKQIKLNIDIEPSYVIIPQLGCLDSAHDVLLVSLGHVNLSSDLIAKSEIPKVKQLIASHSDKDLIEKMRKMAFESYKCRISEVQVILSDVNHWTQDLKSMSTTRHLLYPVEFNLSIKRSIVSNDPLIPKLKIKGKLPNIELKISDSQLTKLMNLLLTLPFSESSSDKELDDTAVDGLKNIKTGQKNIATIEMSRQITDAMNFATETTAKIGIKEPSVEETESTDGEKQIIAYKSVVFDFKLNKIVVTLFEGIERSVSSAIATAKLSGFEIYGEILTDSTLWTIVRIGDLSLDDIRTTRKDTGVKTLIEKNQIVSTDGTEPKDSMFSLHMTQKSNERFINISISGFRLIVALDYLLNIANMVTKAFDTDKTKDANVIKDDKPNDVESKVNRAIDRAKQLSSATVEKTSVINVLLFNLNQVDVVLLESIEVTNSSAVIMSCFSKIHITQNPEFIDIHGEVADISMLLTNYDRYISSRDIDAYIMRPINLSINGKITGDSQMLDVTLSDVEFFISPPMVNILLKIVSKLGSNSNTQTDCEECRVNVKDLFKVKPNDSKKWYLSYVAEAEEVTENFIDVVDSPTEINTKQQLYLNINSVSIVVESGGLDSQPLIKLKSYFTGKLVGYKSLSANCSLIADYYNENKFFWEPLIEPIEGKPSPWDFDINVALQDSGKIDVKLESNEQLELTITKTSIFVLSSLNEAFANAITRQLPTREDNIVIVTNFLGFDLRLYLTESNLKTKPFNKQSIKNKHKSQESEIIVIKAGEELSLVATDLKEVELNIAILMSDGNEINRSITCHGQSIRCYNLPKKTYPTNLFWKWVVDVQDMDAYTKKITFKSNAQIVNQFKTPLDIYCIQKEQTIHLGCVKASSTLELPLEAIYGECEIKVKPSNDYLLCDKTIDWRSQIDKRNTSTSLCLPFCDSPTRQPPLILTSNSESNPNNKFYIKVKCDQKDVQYEDSTISNVESVLYEIRLIPIVKLRNLLPYTISYAIENIDELIPLESGDESDLSAVRLGETGLSLTLVNYLEKDWYCFKTIPSYGPESDVYLWKFTASDNHKSQSIDLAVKLSIENSTIVLSLYSPFWMINRTSQQLVYRVDDETVIFHQPTVLTPVLLCFKPKNLFCKKKLCLSIGDSRFSDGFSVDVAGSKGNIIAKSKNGKYNYYVSIDVQLSRIGLSKIVTITPFYSIVNVSSKSIEISEDNDEFQSINSFTTNAFWPKRSTNQSIFLRFDSKSNSSKPLSLTDSLSTLVEVDGQYLYVDVDISEWDATVKISDYFEGAAPVMLVNALKGPISFGQKGVTVWSSKTGEQKYVSSVPANCSVYYTWYLPSSEQQLVWKYEPLVAKEQTMDIKRDAVIDINDVFVVSFLDGKQRVCLFTHDFSLATNALQAGEITKPNINVEIIMKGIGLSIVNNEAKRDVLYIAITSSVLWEFRSTDSKRFKALPVKSIDSIESSYQKVLLNKKIGENSSIVSSDSMQLDFTDSENPKLIAPKNGQLRRLANRGIWISVALSEHIIQCHLKVNRLQIDNQMPDHIFGIVMCPIAPPKTIAIEHVPKSFIEMSTIIEKTTTMNRFKYNSILIQEFLIQIDRGLLSAIQELFEVTAKKEDNKKLIAKDVRDILQLSTITESLLSSRKSYYDFIHFSPLKVHLSFSMAGAAGGHLPLGLDFFVRSAGVTLTEFNDVVFKLDYFERKNILVENSELISIVTKHYTTQVLKQFYVLVLGLDLIGNPMKLVLGLKEGVGDFFYEPFQGIIQGPGEFAEGISIGVKSLASNVVGGAAGALGSITSTIGEGVSVLTMDDKFRQERRTRLNRKAGFAESGKNLFRGVFSGVTGVITKPFEGVKEDGFEGLIKGVGKGVVGIVVQPTTGVIDFASGSLQALKRAVDPNQEAKQIRAPRYIGFDEMIRPYNRHHATGNQILKEMENRKYVTDNYIIHYTLNSNLTIITDRRLMSVKRGSISHHWETDWAEEWTNCDKLSLSGDRLKIIIKLKESKRVFGIFSGDSDRIITTNSVEASQWLIEQINKQLRR